MADSKLVGSLNLARLENVGIMSIKGNSGAVKKCVVIPIDDNDIFIKVEEKTSQHGSITFPNSMPWASRLWRNVSRTSGEMYAMPSSLRVRNG